MTWQQITIIVLASASLSIALINHGKPKTGKENFWVTLIANAITISILYSAGFFK